MRIAAHPDMARAGYGSKAVQLLRRYYQGELASLDEEPDAGQQSGKANGTANGAAGTGDRPEEECN